MEYWGEIEASSNQNLVPHEKESLLPIKRVDIEPPPLDLPSNQTVSVTDQSKMKFVLDPYTLHTIRLLQYARKMRNLINQVQLQLLELKALGRQEVIDFPVPPELPPLRAVLQKLQPEKVETNTPKHILPVKFRYKEFDSDFTRGFGKPPPQIDDSTCHRFLRRSVAAISAHAGYDDCCESVLETVTDVAHDFLSQMTQLLRRAVDGEAQSADSGFPDPMERVFHEMGLGDTSSVHDFYQQRILQYHRNVLESCQKLRNEYNKMKEPGYNIDESNNQRNREEEEQADLGFDEAEEIVEEISVIEGLYAIGVSSQGEEEARWPPQSVRSEQSESRLAGEPYDDLQSVGSAMAHTPAMSSEAGESIQDPSSVAELMSPPSTLPPPRGSQVAGRKRKR